jgi:hypothetical protein
MDKPKYIKWLVKEEDIKLEDGYGLNCFRLEYETNEEVFDEWALHLRQHYESNSELIESLNIYNLEVEDYLREYVIPQSKDAFGPTSRSNDITEILTADLFEFVLGYKVPRCKQRNRSGKTNSEHGSDILAYKLNKLHPSESDILAVIEVKAGLSSDSYEPISESIKHSKKYDPLRYAQTINYYRKKLSSLGEIDDAEEIARFSKKPENNYIIKYLSSAVISRKEIENKIIVGLKGRDLELVTQDTVFLIHGEKLMELTNCIYERCKK